MTAKDLGKTLKDIVEENKNLLEDTWETFPDEMKEKVKQELNKVSEQVKEYLNKKKEQQN